MKEKYNSTMKFLLAQGLLGLSQLFSRKIKRDKLPSAFKEIQSIRKIDPDLRKELSCAKKNFKVKN